MSTRKDAIRRTAYGAGLLAVGRYSEQLGPVLTGAAAAIGVLGLIKAPPHGTKPSPAPHALTSMQVIRKSKDLQTDCSKLDLALDLLIEWDKTYELHWNGSAADRMSVLIEALRVASEMKEIYSFSEHLEYLAGRVVELSAFNRESNDELCQHSGLFTDPDEESERIAAQTFADVVFARFGPEDNEGLIPVLRELATDAYVALGEEDRIQLGVSSDPSWIFTLEPDLADVRDKFRRDHGIS